jgi:hypothetical protein
VEDELREIELQLKGHFKLKTSAENKWLGLKIDKSINGIYISARTKIESLLKDIGMADCKPCTTPAAPGSKLPKLENTEDAVTSFPYREAVGALLWLARTARPDIGYAVAELTKHCNAYGNEVTASSVFSSFGSFDPGAAGVVHGLQSAMPISFSSDSIFVLALI